MHFTTRPLDQSLNFNFKSRLQTSTARTGPIFYSSDIKATLSSNVRSSAVRDQEGPTCTTCRSQPVSTVAVSYLIGGLNSRLLDGVPYCSRSIATTATGAAAAAVVVADAVGLRKSFFLP